MSNEAATHDMLGVVEGCFAMLHNHLHSHAQGEILTTMDHGLQAAGEGAVEGWMFGPLP
jgi:hypothetical protein